MEELDGMMENAMTIRLNLYRNTSNVFYNLWGVVITAVR